MRASVCIRHGWRYWLAVTFFGVISVASIGVGVLLALNPPGRVATAYWVVLAICLPFAFIQLGFVLVLRSDRIVEARDDGVRLYRGDRLKTVLLWGQVAELRLGYLPLASKYHGHVQRGYRVEILGQGQAGRIVADSLRYDVSTEDLSAFSEKISMIAESHAVPVRRTLGPS